MGTVFKYQCLRLLRDRPLLLWTVAFPIALSSIFMFMFADLDDSFRTDPIALGVIEDDAYRAAPELSGLVARIGAAGENQLAEITTFPNAAEADEAAGDGRVAGYLVVIDGEPVLRLTPAGNDTETSLALRAVLDAWRQIVDQYQEVAVAGVDPTVLNRLGETEFQTAAMITPEIVKPQVRYYLALLAFACGSGMTIAIGAFNQVTATASPVGSRRTLSALPRGQLLLATTASAWLCTFTCMLVALGWVRFVAGVDLGPRAPLTVAAIAISTLMSSAIGAWLGTFRAFNQSLVPGVSAALSLFTGLYGPQARAFADGIEQNLPLLAHINPLWQSTHAFYSLLYHHELTPFAINCAEMTALTILFLVLALIRLRKMSYDHV